MQKWRLLCLLIFICTYSHAQNTLDFYLQQAKTSSPLLKDLHNQVLSNTADSAILRATLKPQVSGAATAIYPPVIKGYGYDNMITNGGTYAALVSVNKPIVGSSRINTELASIDLLNQSLKNNSKITGQDVVRSVTAQYITAYGSWQQWQFNKQVLDLLQKGEQALKELTEKNVYRQTDYLTYLVTLQQQELVMQQAKVQFQTDVATLNYICGINDTSAVQLQTPSIQISVLPDINHSIFFHQFLIDSLKLTNSRTLIDFGYHAKGSVFADAGYLSSLSYEPYKNFGASIGASISVPIFDGHQRKMQYNKLAIADNTRLAYKDFYTKQYNQQIAQLTQQLHATDNLIADINKQLKYSEELINVDSKLLETGDAKIADYILALNNYLTTKNLLTQNSITRLQIINQLNYWNK